jgi:hypothetical protein
MKEKIQPFGSIPFGPTILAAADHEYFKAYGYAFVKSSCYNGNKTHIHLLTKPKSHAEEKELFGNLRSLKERFKNLFTFTLDMYGYKGREEFASARFHVAPIFMDMASRFEQPLNLMILDIDSVVRRYIQFPKAAVGLFFREPFGANEWERRGTRVAAGAVFYDHTSTLFAKKVSDRIYDIDKKWFADQVALAETADEFKLASAIYDFSKDNHFLDWEFHDDGIIWTGKGDRKFNNKRYLAEFDKWNNI